MPAAPKSPLNKKPGAPKAKGAVRAKSGCYTCRIRRKKCDERANQDGHCETCVRLRLQCLGFGAKRPEWLRESRNVSDMRDKIKSFLAAQGMIKGHSGAGPRGSEHDLPILRLEEDSTPSSSESPPTPTLSLSPSEAPRTLQHESAIREQRTAWIGDPYGGHTGLHMRGGSPFGGSSHSSHPDMPIYSTSYNSPNSIVPWNPPTRSPALFSSFSDTYHAVYEDDSMYCLSIEDEDVSPLGGNPSFSAYLKPSGSNDELLNYYLGNVMDLQYLLADSDQIRTILFPSVTSPGTVSRQAARLLASIHCQRAACRSNTFYALQDMETKSRYEDLQAVLKKQRYTQDDALAAISIISSFLFDGGAGAWQEWLTVSYTYAASFFGNRDPCDTLQHCGETTRFIIKAAIWFDVLAAITTQQSPRFLYYIRRLFSPEASGIYDPALPPSPELSMLSVMGCENHVVWALAETSALAVWKAEQLRHGRLSVPDLVARAATLDAHLVPATPPPPLYPPSARAHARALSAHIFRAATRVYLRTVVSGDFPHVPEIAEGIDEALAYMRVPPPQRLPSSVVRSTVFAFFLCGALTDDRRTRQEVYGMLNLDGEDPSTSTVGNSGSIQRLLERLWTVRSNGADVLRSPVRWRDVLKDSHMLLV
ncbi:fungal-specific transcription factor domain-containing protein [Mycena sp. CBHHK59/15]|nr:fungal-specific transcription factor domain-containing protein [Mycena sp. CBHHK59/15]